MIQDADSDDSEDEDEEEEVPTLLIGLMADIP
jgi:hypothetical protein